MGQAWQDKQIQPEVEAPVADQTQAPAAEQSQTTFLATGTTVPPVADEQTGGETASQKAGYDDDKAKRSAAMTAKHGVRPRDYSGVLNGSNAAELIIREAMPRITTFLNERAAAQKLDTRFTVNELTTNFIAEGGFLALNDNITENLDGFTYAGVDTFMDRYNELKPWLHSSITKDKVAAQQNTNEKGESVQSIGQLTLVQAAWANATMYAAGKARLEKWLKKRNKDIDGLSENEQFYWATTYYNAGEGFAEKQLAANGVGAANTKWSRPDDWQKYHRNATYNAKMRTSTFEMNSQQVFENDQFRPVDATTQAAAGPDVDAQVQHMRELVAYYEDLTQNNEAKVADLQQRIKAAKGAPAQADGVPMLEYELSQLMTAKAKLEPARQQLEVLEAAKANQLAPAAAKAP